MQKQKLLKLANALDTYPARKFDLYTWKDIYNTRSNKCRTTACACGLQTIISPRGKLKLIALGSDASVFELRYGIYSNMLAAAKCFGLNMYEADYLFSLDYYPTHYRGPKSVAKRIRKFVESNGKSFRIGAK